MNNFKQFLLGVVLSGMGVSAAHADYTIGTTMFQIYGGGAGLSGHYNQPGVNRDEQYYADGGGIIGGQFLYFFHDSPCLAAGFDVSHASFDDHDSNQLLTNLHTASSADDTVGLVVLRISYPRGHFRPYIQGGVGAHHTSLSLDGIPLPGQTWGDTGTTETRSLLNDGHMGAALEGAIGIHIYFTERFFVGAELKIVDLGGKDFMPTAAGVNEGLNPAPGAISESGIGLMLGLGF